MDAGTADAEIKPVRDIKYLVDTMRILSRAITHYESRSGTTATEHTYAARLIDVMVRIYAPIASKPGSKGGTLSQALSSRSILKQMQEKDDQLTWKEIMDTCIRFGEENAGQHTVTSMLANSDNADKAGTGGDKGGKGNSDKADKADKGGQWSKGRRNELATTNGTSTGLCLHHCIKGSCDFRSPFCQEHLDAAHPPARAGHGILASECAKWPGCSRPDSCLYGLRCIFKHGDGSEQIAKKHGQRPAGLPGDRPAGLPAKSYVASASPWPSGAQLTPPPATQPTTSAMGFDPATLAELMTDIRADLRATNQQLLASVTPSGSSPVSLPLPVLSLLLCLT